VKRLRFLSLALVLAFAVACAKSSGPASSGAPSASSSSAVTLHLGHFPNLTHAPAIYGVEKGIFAKNLGPDVKIDVKRFNAGPEAVQALFSGDLDIAYVGPNPAINAFQKSKGDASRIIAGATQGGAALVVKSSITDVSQLKGKILATPQQGNTQDVALRAFLKSKGYKTDTAGGGDVKIRPQENSQTLDTFKAGQIDGAWVPEPYVSRLVTEDGAHILVDEKTLWAGGTFDTTVVIVRKAFADQHPDVVKNFLKAHVETIDAMKADPNAANVVNDAIAKITGKSLKPAALKDAWARLTFTWDPAISALEGAAKSAHDVGLLNSDDISGISDLSALNAVLRSAGKAKV
jgi:NitT/TauT family transport system substrate-binding protein